MTPTFLDDVAPLIQRIDDQLQTALEKAGLPVNLHEAASHAVLGGGKRLRPVLAILCCEAVGGGADDALPAAIAIELIHAFSLVHDDLPALDNDQLRRGLPTVHVKFGEAMAVLTGDVLISLAFETAAESARSGIQIVKEIARATTLMINGQVYDTLGGFPKDLTDPRQRLNQIHRNKTGALLTAACRTGALAGGTSPSSLRSITQYGDDIGLMFQIVDDLLDVTQSAEHTGKATGKDQDAGKTTFPGVFGIEASQAKVRELRTSALSSIQGLGTSARHLRDLCEYLSTRTR